MSLLDQPHHDGSPLYVSDSAPRLGDIVTVRVRVPVAAGFTRVLVRVTPDGEQQFVEARLDRRDAHETWWAADLVCHNPVTRYRFVLEGGPLQYAWLNGRGLHLRDVPDSSDFRLVAYAAAPDWAQDAVVYQIFPDRFATTGAYARPAPSWAEPAAWEDPLDQRRGHLSRQLYGGDLDGVVEHLDHIASLGADVIYLTPFFPGRSNHRYDATTFDEVDPLLGGESALTRLCAEAHARGMRVLGDFTTNHTGSGHEWFVRAKADPDSPERGFYFFDAAGGYVGWLGVPSLPKLNYDSSELSRRLFDDPLGVVRRWLTAGLDGWRIDVGNMTGRMGSQERNHEVQRDLRVAAVRARPDALVVAEHVHDVSLDVDVDGWHGVMNYAGFMKPVWTWLRRHDGRGEFLGAPVLVPELPAELAVQTMRDFTSRFSWRTLCASFNLLGSHDSTRIHTLVGGDPARVEVAVGLLMTMPSIPMLTYGDEIGMGGEFGEDGRRPMPWDETRWDTTILAAYRALIAARRESRALRGGGLRWVHAEGDAIVYLRETATEVALVHCARAAHEPVVIDASLLPGVEHARTAYGPELGISGVGVTLTADRPRVGVWTWEVA